MQRTAETVLVVGDGRVLGATAALAALVGRSCRALTTLPLEELVPREALDRLARLQPGERGPLPLICHDGSQVVLHVEVARLDLLGVSSLVFTARDDADPREVLQERMMLTDRMTAVGTLAAGVAHEINNPLAMVLANLELLSDELQRAALPAGVEAPLVERIDAAVSATERVQRVVTDLRTFSRYDTGSHPVDVVELLATSIRMMEKELRGRARLQLDLGACPLVEANPARLGHVFLNLLQNAAQATPDGAPDDHLVAVRCGPLGGRVRVEIRDTGEGMDDLVRRRAFEPFFTTRPVGTGTGLGLSYCHNVVSTLGGEIVLESAPGAGTLVTVFLPAAMDVELGGEPPEPPPPTSDARLRILVVDDEPEIGAVISALLHDHRVHACDGEAALDSLDRGWDVVLCDLMMPRVSGLQVFDHARRVHPDLAGAFVFLTGGATSVEVEVFLETCGRPVLTKPFRIAQLRAVIEQVLLDRMT